MDAYPYYKQARDRAWQALIDCGINRLPIYLNLIANYYRIKLITYSRYPLTRLFKPDALEGDGFIVIINNRKTIFLNDQIKTRGRRRFTVGHELGHGLLNHPLEEIIFRNSEIDSKDNPLEMQANVSSRDILAPACILRALNVTTPEEIMRICRLSRVSSEIRLSRLNMLIARDAFFKSPLERQVYVNFKEYIINMGGKYELH